MECRCLLVLLVAAAHVHTVLAARILALCTLPSPSHSLWCHQYMALLADRGHQITIFGVDEPKFNIPNLTTFIVNDIYGKPLPTDFLFNLSEEDQSTVKTHYYTFKDWFEAGATIVMRSRALKQLVKYYENTKKPFDLIIHDSGNIDIPLGLVHVFGNPPLVLATVYGTPQWMTYRAGNIFNPAYVPSMIADFDQQMTFYERSLNTFYYIFLELMCNLIIEPFEDQLTREVLGSDVPPVKDIAKRANVILVNHHFALGDPRPLLPGVVEIPGLHISDPKLLPQDLKDFMDKAEHGVILLSMGTNLRSDLLPGFEDVVVKALGQLPQHVLWKWDKTIANLPPNIKVSKWLPQADILVHPKLHLFISHCGQLSIQEAIYRKVPVLALPVFLDQGQNAAFLVKHNLAVQLKLYRLTADQLRNGVNELLSNPIYKANMARMGELMRDTPLTPQQQAVFWTEYALRHQGAPHLRSVAADLPWHQYFLLDVFTVILVGFIIILWFFRTVFLFILRKNPFKKVKKD